MVVPKSLSVAGYTIKKAQGTFSLSSQWYRQTPTTEINSPPTPCRYIVPVRVDIGTHERLCCRLLLLKKIGDFL